MAREILERKLASLIEPTLEGLGFELVRVQLSGDMSSPTVQIMAERPDGRMTLDDCAEVSQSVSTVLDVEDILSGAYTLEVSSPGIDRPLTRVKDFDKFKGFEAKIEIEPPGINGQKKFRGKIIGTENGATVCLETEEGETCALPFDRISRAKLVMTDDLLKMVQQQHQQQV